MPAKPPHWREEEEEQVYRVVARAPYVGEQGVPWFGLGLSAVAALFFITMLAREYRR